MKGRRHLALVVASLAILSCGTEAFAKPSFNGTAAGCGGSGCHTFQSGIVSPTAIGNLQVRVTLAGAGTRVAGELVNGSGVVVAVIDQTTSNPFTLTAPQTGTYRVSAGFDSPNRRWDTVRVNITTTSVSEGNAAAPGRFSLRQNYQSVQSDNNNCICCWQVIACYTAVVRYRREGSRDACQQRTSGG